MSEHGETSAADVLGEGKFLRLVKRGGWEFVERTNVSGVVGLLATTADGRMILVEQWREAMVARCVELPAGLVGDVHADEDAAESAARELEEETGFRPAHVERIVEGCVSAGLTGETVALYRATGLEKIGDGGGEPGSGEEIEVHAVPVADVPAFLRRRIGEGRSVDLKVWAALWFLGR